MKIISLNVENIKKIKAVHIEPKDNTIVISGKNGNGKSSTLDSIAMALGGKELVPEKPVRDGEQTAEIKVDLGEYQVRRWWTSPETSYLELKTKEGAKIANAQSMLDKIIGELTFDPLEFSTMEPSKRLKVLKSLVGVSFDALDAEYKKTYEERTLLNRDVKNAYASLVPIDEIPKVEFVDLEQVRKARQEASEKNESIKELVRVVDKEKKSAEDCEKEILRLEESILSLQNQVTNIKNRRDSALDFVKKNSEAFFEPLIDLSQFDKQIDNAFAYARYQEKISDHKKASDKISALDAKVTLLNARMAEIEHTKAKTLEAAKMPVEGLSISDKDVLFNGIPFAQLSQGEQIKVSFAIAIKMNPRLRVALIRNGSLLDSDALAQIKTISTEQDFQCWVEKTSDSPDGNSIFIQDGELKQGE